MKKGFMNKKSLAIIAVVIIIVLTIGGIVYFKNINLARTAQTKPADLAAQASTRMFIYFDAKASKQDIQSLISEIEKVDGVIEVKYTSSDESYELFKKNNINNLDLAKMGSADIFPATIDIHVQNPQVKEKVSALAKNKSFVSDVLDFNFKKYFKK